MHLENQTEHQNLKGDKEKRNEGDEKKAENQRGKRHRLTTKKRKNGSRPEEGVNVCLSSREHHIGRLSF